MISVSSWIASFKLSHHKIKLILLHYFDYLYYFDTFLVIFRSLSVG